MSPGQNSAPGSVSSSREVAISLADGSEFHESLLLGNGRMGAAVYGSSRQVRVNLNRSDIWDYRYDGLDIDDFSYALVGDLVRGGRWGDLARLKDACMRAYMKHYPGYAPAGELEMLSREAEGEAHASLSLDQAVVSVRWDSGARMDCFVAFESDVLATMFTETGSDSYRIALFRHANEDYSAPRVQAAPEVATLVFRFPDGFEYAMAVAAAGWEFSVQGGRLLGCSQSRLSRSACFLAIATSSDGDDPEQLARSRADEAAGEGWDQLLRRHTERWGQFWGQSDLTLSDTDIERAWRSQIYQLGSCSRLGSLPPNLQGIWNAVDHPDWHSNWTFDLNVQITAWPVFTANHPDIARPYADYLLSILPEVKRQTQRYWGLPGAKFGSACDPLGREFFGYLTASYWAGSSAWALEPVIWYWRNTRDAQFARSTALPLLESALDFYAAFLTRDGSGTLHVPLTTSPEAWENGDEAWGRDATLDLAALRQLARAVLDMYDAAMQPGRHCDFCREMLESLAQYPTANASWSELEGKAYPEPHRHLSVLSPIYPIAEIEDREDVRQTALASYRAFVNRGPVADWGCTLSWLSMVASRLGIAEDALQWLHRARLTLGRTYLHRLHFEVDDWSGKPGRSIYEIDGGAGFAAALNEMLLSALRGRIRLFPAVPRAWSCSFRDFRAEGGLLVTSESSRGRIGPTAITSLNGAPCVLERTGSWERVRVTSSGHSVAFDDDGRLVRFATEKGARYDVTFD